MTRIGPVAMCALAAERLVRRAADRAEGAAGRADPERAVALSIAARLLTEGLGCGALLAAAFAGGGALVVMMTDGAESHPGSARWPGPRLAAQRRAELLAAIAVPGGGADVLTCLNLPDGNLYAIDPAPTAGRIVALIDRTGARTVLCPSPVDAHADHKATARIARLARQHRTDTAIYLYPVWSRRDEDDVCAAHGAAPVIRFDTAPWRDHKRRAIGCHHSQLGLIVDDAPGSFTMDPAFVTLFVTGDELFSTMDHGCDPVCHRNDLPGHRRSVAFPHKPV